MPLQHHWTAPIVKLVALLVLLPAAITYAHLAHWLRQSESCLVGPASFRQNTLGSDAAVAAVGDSRARAVGPDLSALYGVYRPGPTFGAPAREGGSFLLVHRPFAALGWWPPSFLRFGWPSAASIATELASPWSTLSRKRRYDTEGLLEYAITFVRADEKSKGGGKWCLRRLRSFAEVVDGMDVCSEPTVGSHSNEEVVHRYPPSGRWTLVPTSPAAFGGGEAAESLSVQCPGPPDERVAQAGAGSFLSGILPRGVRRNPNKKQERKPNKNIEQIVRRPATTLLLSLNVGLAFCYWNNRVSPSSVAKIYTNVVHEHEIWRSFTGATAHFEPLHIGFNMMSLYSLGMELEEGYGSIPFLFYNVALVVLTTAVMMGMTYLRIKHTGNAGLAEVSTVGYSGVLFAWMVITSLERESTCPVPFVPDMCFTTHSFLGGAVKFNVSPIVQLFVAQFIMPRVSFVGHLAGIVCGFALHWSMIPLELASPNVLLPAALLAHLRFARGIIPRPEADEAEDDDSTIGLRNSVDDDVNSGGPSSPRQRRSTERGDRFLSILVRTQSVVAFFAVSSLLVLDPTGSMVLSQFLSLSFFVYGVLSSKVLHRHRLSSDRSLDNERALNREKFRGGAIWRGAVLSLTLLIVADAMTLSSWMSVGVAVPAGRLLSVGLVPALVLLVLRIIFNSVALVLAVGALHDLGEVGGGIFIHSFGPILRWSKAVGDGALAALSSKPLYTPFEGRGVALGGGGLLNSLSDSTEEGGSGHIL